MSLYKRGGVYWCEFQFNGERIQESSHASNRDAARQIEAAHRVRLVKGEAGIIERLPAPTPADFTPRFRPPLKRPVATNRRRSISTRFLKLDLQFGHLALKPCPVSVRRRLIVRLARTLRHAVHSTPPGVLPPRTETAMPSRAGW